MTVPAWLKGAAPALTLLGLAAVILGGLTLSAPEPSKSPEPPPPLAISGTEAAPGTHAPRLRLYGAVETRQHSTLRAQVTADIRAIHVAPGQRVDAGAVLITLDDREAQLTVARAEATLKAAEARRALLETTARALKARAAEEAGLLALAERRWARTQQLHRQGMLSDSERDSVETALREARLRHSQNQEAVDRIPFQQAEGDAAVADAAAQRALAQRALESHVVRAPFPGPVESLAVGLGERVSGGAALLTLSDESALEVRATVASARYHALSEALAQGERLQANAQLGGQALALTLTRLAGQQRADGTAFDAYFSFVSTVPPGAEGQNLRLDLALPAVPNSVVLPATAVFDQRRIYRVVDGRLEALPAQILGDGPGAGGLDELVVQVPGLTPGDAVMTSQHPQAAPGLRVEITQEPATPTA
jgi:multidrug efflux pump subunit AcrA (membrane-fusion protein)